MGHRSSGLELACRYRNEGGSGGGRGKEIESARDGDAETGAAMRDAGLRGQDPGAFLCDWFGFGETGGPWLCFAAALRSRIVDKELQLISHRKTRGTMGGDTKWKVP